MAVGFGGIIAEAFQDINSDLLLFAEAFMGLKTGKQLILQLHAFMFYAHIPGLMVDAGAGDVQLLPGDSQNLGNLALAVNLTVAQADGFVREFPDGYNTQIVQGGNNVSGGQKQRLCIARALLKKPKILILDDSTSAVDTKTDALIRKAFREEIPNTTKIIIAQRVSSIEDADQIIVLENGEISGIGTSEELLKTNAIYREVYVSQVKGGEDHE